MKKTTINASEFLTNGLQKLQQLKDNQEQEFIDEAHRKNLEEQRTALDLVFNNQKLQTIKPNKVFEIINSNPTILFDAASCGSVALFNFLKEKLTSEQFQEIINITNNTEDCGSYQGETLLHMAAIEGNLDVVNILLESGIDKEKKAEGGLTALHYAAAEGHDMVALRLLVSGSNINAQDDDGFTPLHYAVKELHIATIDKLLEKKADHLIKANNGYTATDFAVELSKDKEKKSTPLTSEIELRRAVKKVIVDSLKEDKTSLVQWPLKRVVQCLKNVIVEEELKKTIENQGKKVNPQRVEPSGSAQNPQLSTVNQVLQR